MRESQTDTSDAELISATPPRKLFPGEDRDAFKAFRLALLDELGAVSFYERQMAENLVDLEWEAVRYQNLRSELLTAQTRDGSLQAIVSSVEDYGFEPSKDLSAIAADLFEADGPEKKAAEAAIELTGTNLNEIMSRACTKEVGTLSHIERHLADIEPRRRRLVDDYDRLKSRRRQDIPDAEIVDDD